MADDNTNPVFQIQRIYLKDLSLEQPNSPQILLEQGQPQVEINLALGAGPIGEGVYEVTVTATVTTKVNDKVLFLVEAKRAIISDVCTRAGFPPVLLSEVNFQAMFEAQQAQVAKANGSNGSASITNAT